jgi:predicted transcriptional regulator
VVVIPLARAEAVLARLRTVQATEKAAEETVKSAAASFASWREIHRQTRIIQS